MASQEPCTSFVAIRQSRARSYHISAFAAHVDSGRQRAARIAIGGIRVEIEVKSRLMISARTRRTGQYYGQHRGNRCDIAAFGFLSQSITTKPCAPTGTPGSKCGGLCHVASMFSVLSVAFRSHAATFGVLSGLQGKTCRPMPASANAASTIRRSAHYAAFTLQ